MIVDFLIGAFLVNALPHFLFGRLKIGVLSLFGYSPRRNLIYAAFCTTMALVLYLWKYGLSTASLQQNMMLVGAAFIVVCYLTGWNLVDRFLRNDKHSSTN